ncbi:MAG: histidine phosphatase family protein, partial [Ktedonobacterales bacterium]
MRLLIVRHGATANNAEGHYTGQSAAPLSALGVRQVATLAERLAPVPLDAIITSDLPRAVATAQQIAAGHSCDLTLDPDLRELSLGDWEGLS